MLCLLLSGAGMASSCRKYSSTWTYQSTAGRRKEESGSEGCSQLQSVLVTTSPSWQEIWVSLKEQQASPEKPQEGTVGRAVAWVLPSPPSHVASGESRSLRLGPLPCTTRWERLAGPCVGQAEATSVKSGGVRWSLSPHTWDMTSRDQLSVMDMGWLGLAGTLLSFSDGRSSVGPKTVARLCRDILFTVSFSATLQRAKAEGATVTWPTGWG